MRVDTTPTELILKQIEMGPMMNYVYIIGCAETHEAAVVDPAWDVPAILRIAGKLGLRLRHALLTHAHPDHINGLEELLQATDAKAYLNEAELGYLSEMGKFFQTPVGFLKRRPDNIQLVSDDEELRVGKILVRCLHTPGHTPGSQCFLIGKNLFSGDTLFVDACGRIDLPGGDGEKMWWSLNRKLRALEDDIILYPGHNYGGQPTSTLGEQKRSNPYMQFDSPDEFLQAMSAC
jgi:glyoxylase-like metal-dependent hydrolase (beta-lactamase superfamily II)